MQLVPVSNDDGFYDLDALGLFARRVSFDEFFAAFKSPALQMTIAAERASSQAALERSIKPTLSEDKDTRREESDSSRVLHYAKKVCFLRKRPGNPFPNMISVGRAMKNDIAIVLETVSKVHAYFLNEGNERWSLADHKSKNGTFLNNKALEPSKSTPIRDGDVIRIGLEVSATFFGPKAFYTRLRGA